MATFKELVDGLTAILKEHPELSDKEVMHASECGHSVAGFESPVTVAVPVFTQEFKDSDLYVRIVSDDDGYLTDRIVTDWKFTSSKARGKDNGKD